MSRDGGVPMDELLAHRDWVARLARQLAGQGAADDVEQETWFAALRSPPKQGKPARAWLATVVHNAVRLRFRDQSRRGRRDRDYQAQEPEHVEGVDRVYERMELQRLLAEQVLALEEPLRAVVVLRYVEGLDSSEIAERLKAPSGTVRWRLKTALDRLRTAMDQRCGGDRRVWVAVMAPGALPGRPPAPASPEGGLVSSIVAKGALVMAHTKLKLSLVALAMLALLGISGMLLWQLGGRSSSLAGAAGDRVVAPGAARALGASSDEQAALAAPGAGVGTLEGMVQDDVGAPIAGALVLATAAPGGPGVGWSSTPLVAPAQTVSAADGSFQLRRLPPGGYTLTATQPDRGAARPRSATLIASQTVRGILLVIARGRAGAGLSGRVVDSGGGPISGARVLAGYLDGDTPVAFVALTGGDGHYSLPLPAGDYRFQAEADGYAAGRFSMRLHLPMVRDFRLHPASRLTGRVSTDGGQPLPGAEVSLVDLHAMEGRMVTRTTFADAGGAFLFGGLDPSSYRIVAHAGPYVGQHPVPVAVGLAQDVAVDVRLDRGRRLRGTVRAASGAPLADVAIMVPFGPLEFLASRQPGVRASSDGQGRFALEGLPPVTVEVLATARTGRARQMVNLMAGDRDDVTLTIGPDGVVAGIVLASDRRPVAGARVAATTSGLQGSWSRPATTDEAGRFRLQGLGAGPLVLSAMHPTGVVELAVGKLEPGVPREVELVLTEGVFVSGTVRTPGGDTVAAHQVFAFAGGWNPSPWGQPTSATETTPDGRYRVGPLPAGEVIVRVASPGDDPFTGLSSRHARADRAALFLRAGEHKRGVDLVLQDNDLTIDGQVLDADGRPVGGAVLNALPDGDSLAVATARTLSQADGQFVIEGLSAGPHTLAVTHPDHPPHRRDHVAAGARGVRVRLDGAGTIAGVVVGRDGRPASVFLLVGRPVLTPDASEQQRRTSWREAPLRTGAMGRTDGAFSFTAVPAGSYELDAFLPDGSVASAPVRLAAGENRTDLRLVSRPGVTIRGRAVDHRTGLPIVAARVEGRGNAAGHLGADAATDGTFSLAGFPAGKPLEFAVLDRSGGHITDCQHRSPPAAGEVVEVGDVPLFAGPARKLTLVGQAATGLWFHSFDGRPTVHSVVPGSPAQAAGARPGEPVLSVDGADVRRLSSSVVEGLVATGGSRIELEVQSAAGARKLMVARPVGRAE